MFNFLCLHLSKVNQEKRSHKVEIETLMNKIIEFEKSLTSTSIKVTNISLTNVDLHTKKDKAELHASKLQGIVHKWAHSHHKLNKIVSFQILDQYEKIIGGNIDEAVKIYKQTETE